MNFPAKNSNTLWVNFTVVKFEIFLYCNSPFLHLKKSSYPSAERGKNFMQKTLTFRGMFQRKV